MFFLKKRTAKNSRKKNNKKFKKKEQQKTYKCLYVYNTLKIILNIQFIEKSLKKRTTKNPTGWGGRGNPGFPTFSKKSFNKR